MVMSISIGGIEFEGSNNSQNIGALTELMFPEFPQDVCADVGIVLGAGITSLFALNEAIGFFESGQISHFMLCGGEVVNNLLVTKIYMQYFSPLLKKNELPFPGDGETEGDYMARYLKNYLTKTRGISGEEAKKFFTVENASKNTGDHFHNIAELDVYKKAKSVNLIGLLPLTRALMTMRAEEAKNLSPRKIATVTNVIPLPGINRNNWDTFEIGGVAIAKNFILEEFDKIDKAKRLNYFKSGFCLDVVLKDEIALAKTLEPSRSAVGKLEETVADYRFGTNRI
jgi:hypothetical protein